MVVQVTIFCKSQALSLLISNLARKPVKSDVENKLKGFLETVVAKEASPSSPVWPLVKSSVAAASQQLRASVPLFAELAVGADPSG